MAITNAIASVAVRDLETAAAWYEKMLGRPADSRPIPELAEWKFQRGGWLQVFEQPQRAGTGSVTLAIQDMENQVARLHRLGIDTRLRTSGPKTETLVISDPDGNQIALTESRDPSMAH
jgi:catechol 2,3-dioxygenase-like lactoylglutathione lyase family enzyme